MALPPLIRRPLERAGFLAAATSSEAGLDPAPIRLGSPQDDEADAPLNGMISRSADAAWLPASWLDVIADNDDPMLNKSGGEGLKLYDALMSDETAMSTLQQRRLAITSKEYEVVAGDDADPRSVKAADDLRAMIDALGFDRVTGLLHYTVWYGYGVAEGIYEIRQHDGRAIVWLKDIVVPDRRWFGFTLEGELRFIGATTALGGEVLPDNKFLTLRTGGTNDFAFYGLGLAHWCYWPIFFKRAAIKFWALYLEKLGRPTVAIGFKAEDKDNKTKKAQLLQAAMSIGEDSAVTVPEEYLKEELIKIFESQRSGNNVSGYKDFVSENNEAIMRVVLGQPGTSKGVSSGLNSNQATEHAGVKEEIVKADSDLITDGIGSTFGAWITRWNHGPDVKPPIVRRILKAGEDLNAVADRDATLDGIGIKRSEASIKATYGDGYELDRETTEEKNAREAALATAKAGAIAAPGSNVVDIQAAKKAKIEEFAAQGGDKPFSPLYVYRPVKPKTAAKLVAFAKSIGITSPLPASELHVTELYSKTAVDWFDMAGEGWDSEELRVQPGGPRFVERFGDAIVLRFDSPVLRYRNAAMREKGASSDHETYNPHVTLGYGYPDLDLATIEPFIDELLFGPEIFEPIKPQGFDPAKLDFTAEEDANIDRLIRASVVKDSPLFEAIGNAMRGSLQGVTTLEGARIAILSAVEQFDPRDLAKSLAVPLIAERSAALIGAESEIDV